MKKLINKLLMESPHLNCGGPVSLLKYKGVKIICNTEACYLVKYNEEAAKVLEIIEENGKKTITTNISIYKNDEETYMVDITKTDLSKPRDNRITEETTMYKYENNSLSKLEGFESNQILTKKHKESKDEKEITRIKKYIV